MADAAFRKHTPEGVARALEILPDHGSYLLLRALQLDYDGVDSTALLERAARVNPLSSAPRIRLGLAAETRGDFSGRGKVAAGCGSRGSSIRAALDAGEFLFPAGTLG